MVGRVDDEYSFKKIVNAGIIPSIENVLKDKETTVDSKVSSIGNLINAYNQFFQTGRNVNVSQMAREA